MILLNIGDIPKQLSTGVQVAAKQVSTQRVKYNFFTHLSECVYVREWFFFGDIPKQLSTGVQVAAKQVSTQRVKYHFFTHLSECVYVRECFFLKQLMYIM